MITSHIKKSLFILVIYLLTIQSALSLENGKPFTDLPHGSEISQIAQNVVAIEITDEKGGMGYCSGIIISQNKILSEAHCFYGKDISRLKIMIPELYINPIDYLAEEIVLFSIKGPNINIKYDKEYKPLQAALGKSANEYIGFAKNVLMDIAIIEPPTGIDHHVVPIINNIEELNNTMFNSNTRFYMFGFGSGIFQYNTRINHVDADTNIYAFNLGNIKSFWNYMIFKYNSPEDIAAYNEFYFQYPTAVMFERAYVADNLYPENGKWSLLEPYRNLITIPSVLLFSRTLPDTEGNIMRVEIGDSGGPVVACNNEGNNCNLIGLIEGKTNSENFITTLAMPFAQKLLR